MIAPPYQIFIYLPIDTVKKYDDRSGIVVMIFLVYRDCICYSYNEYSKSFVNQVNLCLNIMQHITESTR